MSKLKMSPRWKASQLSSGDQRRLEYRELAGNAARITAVAIGHGELYFVIGRGAEIGQVFAVVTDVAGCDCAYQPACRAAERRNFKDGAFAFRVERRGEVNERSGIRRPAGLQVGRGIAGDLQWRAARQQPHPDVRYLAAAGKRYGFAIGRNCRRLFDAHKIREPLER